VVGPLATSVGALKLVIKGILSQQPWLHDPLVHEIPYRDEHERQIIDLTKSGSRLAFGVLRHDGIIQPHPPVRRAIDFTVKTLEKLGHKVIEWTPPSHQRCLEIGMKTWVYDGGRDVHSAFGLSGEPIAPQLAVYRDKPFNEYTATEIAENNVAKREFQKEYLEYWNSTVDLTGTDRPVDAVISPAAQFAAARPNTFDTACYTSWVNVLDYSAAVFPVTTVDKSIDKVDEGYIPLSALDKAVFDIYDPEIYDGAHVSLQLVGRRLQEEKVLAMTEIIGDALGKHVA